MPESLLLADGKPIVEQRLTRLSPKKPSPWSRRYLAENDLAQHHVVVIIILISHCDTLLPAAFVIDHSRQVGQKAEAKHMRIITVQTHRVIVEISQSICSRMSF